MRPGYGLSDAIGEQGAVGQAGQCVVMGHVHYALVGKTPFGDLGLQSGVDAGELERALLDTLLERALGAAQGPLGCVALPVLPLDHAVGMTHDHEQHAVEHAQDREDAEHHHPLHPLDARQKRRDVVVDLEDRADSPVRSAAHGDVGRKQIGVLDDPVERAEFVAMRELAGDAAGARCLESCVAALVLADLARLGREDGAPAHVVDLDLGDGEPAQMGRQGGGEPFTVRMVRESFGRHGVRRREVRHQRGPQ